MKQLKIFSSSSMDENNHTWVVNIDGASRNNPGKSGAGIVMKKDGQVVSKEGFYLGIKTNNQAEYYAFLLGLFFLKKYAKAKDTIRVASDSELLVKQIEGLYKVKNEGLKPLHTLALTFLQKMPITIMHVVRSDNVVADKLANKGIDHKNPLPNSFLTLLKKNGISL